MTQTPHMTPDIAQAVTIELEFIVPDWKHQQIDNFIVLTAPKRFRNEPAKLEEEVMRIYKFICYSNSKDIYKISLRNYRIASSMRSGNGFTLMIEVE